MEWLNVASVTFAALFPLVNPLGALPLFASLTQDDSRSFRKQQAIKTALFTLIILVMFEYAGNVILSFFGLSLGMLQIAGGLIVGHTGWNMATGTPRVSTSERHRLIHDPMKRKRSLAAIKQSISAVPSAVEQLGHSVTNLPAGILPHLGVDATSTPVEPSEPSEREGAQKQKELSGQADISFSPMAMPMLAGPGSIGVVIGLTAQHPGTLNSIGIVVGILGISALTLVCLLLAAQLTKSLGHGGIMAMQRIFGFIVLGIAVALVSVGVSQLFGLQIHG